jgi:hypothetical protein
MACDAPCDLGCVIVRETLLRPVSLFWVARGADVDESERLERVRCVNGVDEVVVHVL